MTDGRDTQGEEKDRRRAPDGARASRLEIGEQTLLVLSYPIDDRSALEGAPLSPAETEVARLAIDGLSNDDIAARRGTSARTVANQMASILDKLDLSSRRELAAWFHRGGIPDAS